MIGGKMNGKNLTIGLGAGVALGVATGSLGTGIALGFGVALALGAANKRPPEQGPTDSVSKE